MKILLLGGTGAMGVHLIEYLKEKEAQVFVTSRSLRDSVGNIIYLHGNAKENDFMKEILSKKWDVIVDFMLYSTNLFKERIDLLLSATSQYIFLSSSRVYANSSSPLEETSTRLLDISKDLKYLSTDEYALTKARQEDMLINSGMHNWTIIRPYITYSENKFQLGVFEKEDWLYRAIHGRTIVFSEDILLKVTTLTYGFDVAKCIESLIGRKYSLGQIFNITTDESNSWRDVINIYFDTIERIIGVRPKYKLLKMSDFLKLQSSKYQVVYDRMFDRKFDNTKICKHSKVNKFIKLEDGLEKCLKQFLKNPTFMPINWSKEAMKDKIVGNKTPLAEIKGIKQKTVYLVYRYLINKKFDLK